MLLVALVPAGGSAGVPPAVVVPKDPLFPFQWGHHALDMPRVWAEERGSRAVKVALLDTGLDFAHPDFAGVAVERGPDYITKNSSEPADTHGHGTMMASIVGAAWSNTRGIAGMVDVTLLILRVSERKDLGDCNTLAKAIPEAADRGARVINLSLSCTEDVGLGEAIGYATRKGALVVVAAGNQPDGPCPQFPKKFPSTLAVAALESYTGQSVGPGSLAFAARGPLTGLLVQPAAYSCSGPENDLAAPGSGMVATLHNQGNLMGYDQESGTSIAAAYVSAAAALLWSHEPSLTAGEVRALLEETATDLGPPGWDEATGHGMVDLAAALQRLAAAR